MIRLPTSGPLLLSTAQRSKPTLPPFLALAFLDPLCFDRRVYGRTGGDDKRGGEGYTVLRVYSWVERDVGELDSGDISPESNWPRSGLEAQTTQDASGLLTRGLLACLRASMAAAAAVTFATFADLSGRRGAGARLEGGWSRLAFGDSLASRTVTTIVERGLRLGFKSELSFGSQGA